MQQLLRPASPNTAFRLNVAPEHAIGHPAWQRARSALLAAVREGGAAALIGPPGSGKTLLLQDLARTLRQDRQAVRFASRTEAADSGAEAEVLLVDEADRIDPAALAALCARPAPLVLAGLPSFRKRLAGLRRGVTPVLLAQLAPMDVARYVADRLAAAGHPRDLMEPEAVLALARHSGGLLRLVNIIGGSAAFLAEMEGASRILQRHVDEAASLRDGMEEEIRPAAPAQHSQPSETLLPVEPSSSAVAARVDAPSPDPALGPAQRALGQRVLGRRALLGVAGAAGLGLVLAGAEFRRRMNAAVPAATDGNPGTAQDVPVGAASAPPEAPLVADRPTVAEPPSQSAPPLAAPPPAAQPLQRAAPEPRPAASAPKLSQQAPMPSDSPMLFRGAIQNETMGQGGQVTISLRMNDASGAVTAHFHAFAGLLGTGELAGSMSRSGRLALSGQLMVGKNPFQCDLSGVVSGDRLTGSASFVRSTGGPVSRSSFTLTRV